MSDACSTFSLPPAVLTFDDAASTNNEPLSDNFATAGGPPGPYTNSPSAFNGISPNGEWRLFMLDDAPGERVGFEMTAFALNLVVEPPAPAAPTTIVKEVTVPGPTITVQAPATNPAATGAAKTGKRAAALAKCRTKKSKEKRAKCKAAAQKLPL